MEAKSVPGKETVAGRRPLRTIAECELAHARLAEMHRFYHRDGLLPLAGLTDVAQLFARDSVLELDEAWQVVRAARATQSIRETFVRGDDYVRLTELATTIPDLSELVSKTGKFFTRDGLNVPFFELNYSGYRIWGATAGMLWNLSQKIAAHEKEA